MNKKDQQQLYMKKRLADPDVSEFEKEQIRKRLGIVEIVTEKDFTDKHGDELQKYVYRYLDGQLSNIRKQKHSNIPIDFLSENLKAIYYLCMYSSYFEEDTLEQIYDTDSEDDYKFLSYAFEMIDRPREALLAKSVLKKRVIKGKDIVKLQEHFDSDIVIQEIDVAFENFVLLHLSELVALQH